MDQVFYSIVEDLILSEDGVPSKENQFRISKIINHSKSYMNYFFWTLPYDKLSPYINKEGANLIIKNSEDMCKNGERLQEVLRDFSQRFVGQITLDGMGLVEFFDNLHSLIFKKEKDKDRNREILREVSLLFGFENEVDLLGRLVNYLAPFKMGNVVRVADWMSCFDLGEPAIDLVKVVTSSKSFWEEDDQNFHFIPLFYQNLSSVIMAAGLGWIPIGVLNDIEELQPSLNWEKVLLFASRELRWLNGQQKEKLFQEFKPLDQAKQSLLKQMSQPVRLIPTIQEGLSFSNPYCLAVIPVLYETSVEDLCKIYDLLKLFSQELPDHKLNEGWFFHVLNDRLSFLEILGCWDSSRLKRLGFTERDWFNLECFFGEKRFHCEELVWSREIAGDFFVWFEGKKLANLVGGSEEIRKVRKDRWI